jgi:DedD protein
VEDGRLKQRLTGAIVLVALGVIFIPMLLSGGRDMEIPVFGSNVPERTQDIRDIKHIDAAELEKPVPEVVNPRRIPIDHKLPEPEIVKEKDKTIVDTIKEATLPDKAEVSAVKETAWAVQVGSFSKRTNALALKDKLQKKNMHAFVERIMNNNNAVYRVRVGPETTKEKAEELNTMLTKDFKLSGIVVKHP